MADAVTNLMSELKQGLGELYGARLRAVYLFASYARHEQDSESDVDVLIVLDRCDRYGHEVDRSGDLVSRLSLKYARSISRVFVSEQEWLHGESPFVLAVRDEAVRV